MNKIRKIFRCKRGESSPLIVAIILAIMILTCVLSEFFRLGIIVKGVRDSLQSAVISVATTNYDEVYNGLREGYSGGYTLTGGTWSSHLDYSDVYGTLDDNLGATLIGSYHTKENPDGSFEFRYYGLDIEITNTALAPGNSDSNFEADVSVQLEVPLSFGWSFLPSLNMEVRTKASYMPKF